MPKILLAIVFIIVTILHADIKFDTTSFNTIEESAKEMGLSLSKKEAKQLKLDIKEIMQNYVMQYSYEKSIKELSKLLKDKTAKDFLKYYDKKQILGGFGIKLNKGYRTKYILHTIKLEDGSEIELVNSLQPSRYFENYFLAKTPLTKMVHTIAGKKSYENTSLCQSTMKIIKGMLIKKYGSLIELKYPQKGYMTYLKRGNSVTIQCTGLLYKELFLNYSSARMNKQSEAEYIEIASSSDEMLAL